MPFRLAKKSLVAATALTSALVMFTPGAANAATLYGSYYNGATGKFEGSFSLLDCTSPCGPNAYDGDLTVNNVKNGYHVRVRYYAQVSGTWYRYLDKLLPDGYSGKWTTGLPPAGAKVRLELCTLDSSYVVRGSCTNRYGINSVY
jgi:hypothetical protein